MPSLDPTRDADRADLRPDYAFVVQLRPPPPDDPAAFRGWSEHVVSGRAAGFDSLEELAAFMARVLQSAPPPG